MSDEKKSKQRSTKIEKDTRVFTVVGWLLNGTPDYLILKNCTLPPPTGWGVTVRQAKRYIEEAYECFRIGRHEEIEDRRIKKIAELEQLKRSMKDSYKGTPVGINAIRMIDELIVKIDGMVVPKKHIHEGGDPSKPLHHNVTVEVVQTGVAIASTEEDVDI